MKHLVLKCPNCGMSHYSEYYSTRTAMYYPPVWKDGVNINPDGNITTTKYHCLECSHDFIAQYRYGKIIDVKDEGEVKPEPYATDTNFTIMSTNKECCTIETNKNENELHYAWEREIDELKERVIKLEKLVGELYAHN